MISASVIASASVINTLRYNQELCIGCEMCSMVCPHAVFTMRDGVAQLARPEACMECGACQRNCPTDAITVDSGVGCAAAMIWGALTGKKEATCGASAGSSCCSPDKSAAEGGGR